MAYHLTPFSSCFRDRCDVMLLDFSKQGFVIDAEPSGRFAFVPFHQGEDPLNGIFFHLVSNAVEDLFERFPAVIDMRGGRLRS